jgi:hypothetical protein
MIFTGDIVLKNLMTQSFEDMRQNTWLIQDVLYGTTNPALGKTYSQEVKNATDWFSSNKINVFLKNINGDKIDFPCITIGLGSSSERSDMATMADFSEITEILTPSTIGKPIPFVVPPFVPISITNPSGLVKLPTTVNTQLISVGMSFLDPQTGNAYPIINQDSNGFYVAPNSMLGATFQNLAVIPQYPIYKARRERAWFDETYVVGCHVVGDVSTLLYLHAIAVYSILRYRQVLLEQRGFMQSSISSSDIMNNTNFSGYVGGDKVFSRNITISGIVENSWLKQPQRYVENIAINPSGSAVDTIVPVVDFYDGALTLVTGKNNNNC